MTVKILYIQPTESFGDKRFLTESFLRISNYLNSKKNELRCEVKETYLDLRFEDLPVYSPETLKEFRLALKALLTDLYEEFSFNIAAIGCYTSFTFLSSIEVAWMVKKINPSCKIIVGGYHPSVSPNAFFPENIPSYFGKYYLQKATPIDAICIDEAEIPFFKYVVSFVNGEIKSRETLKENPEILKRELLKSVDDLPLIDLSLFMKYKNIINKLGEFYLSFNRGCLYRCKFCSSSLSSPMESYRKLRFKSVDKCIAEIKRILDTKWLKITKLVINDAILFPKRSLKDRFFRELEKLNKVNDFPFRIYVHDRMELCTLNDLEYYKKLDIIPGFGLETGSPTLLCRLGKFLGKNNNLQNAKAYLALAEDFIKKSNELDTPIVFLYMGATPGMDERTMKETEEFFFDKRFSGKSLVEKYKVNLQIQKYAILPGNDFFNYGEILLGAKYYFKQWYRILDKEQAFYSTIIKPSKDLNFPSAMSFLINFIKKLYQAQMRLKNPFYTLSELLFHRKMYERFIQIYNAKAQILDTDKHNIGYAYISLILFISFITILLNTMLNISYFSLLYTH